MKKQLLNFFTAACLTSLLTACFTPCSIYAQVPTYVPLNGLSAWYSFSGNANDDSGGNNNGTVSGATLTQGKLGLNNTAYAFNGTSNTIDFSTPFLNGAQVNSFTIHVLIKFNSTANSPNIWGKTYNWGEVNLFVTSNNEIKFVFANNVTGNKYSSIYSAPNVIQENEWYDITITYENSLGQIYVNSEPVITFFQWTAQGGGSLSTTQIEAQCNFAQHDNSSKIGLRYTGAVPGNCLNGTIDEFGIWNRALGQTELEQLNNNCVSSISSQPSDQTINVSAGTAQFTVSTSAATPTYQWQTNNGVGFQNLDDVTQYSGATTNTLAVSNIGMYNNNQPFRCIINSSGCSDTSDIALLNVINNAGISEISKSKCRIYPNPANEVINVVQNEAMDQNYILYDASGRKLLEGTLIEKESQISLTSLQSGNYLLKVSTNELPIRVVKQ
jgi:hypothetical protein